MQDELIKICGAREHNLKGINVDIPRGKLVVITGLSGSGKSSLAFDTLYAEGQRRYVESLSAYARQFIDQLQKPDVDTIEGLSPAISIEQKMRSRNPRSTVATVTEIYDYLRLLYARIGIPYSPATGEPIESQTITQITDQVLSLEAGSKVMIIAPMVRARKGEHRAEMFAWQKMGFTRVVVDNVIHPIDEVPEIDGKRNHDIGIVVDRLSVEPGKRERFASSIETAESLSEGLVEIRFVDGKKKPNLLFSTKFACPVSGFTIEEIEPRIFSFNSPYGACKECGGLGLCETFNLELVVPDEKASLDENAIAPWAKSGRHAPYYQSIITGFAQHEKIDVKSRFQDLSDKHKQRFLYGTGDEKIRFTFDNSYTTARKFEGVIGNLKRRYKETESSMIREEMQKYMTSVSCPGCNGYRLDSVPLAIKIDGMHIGEVCGMPVDQALDWFKELENKLNKKQKEIGTRVLVEIRERLRFLANVGLDYLTLGRGSATLSGGESQRIRLASQIGSRLTGVIYVLDEPSIGLHQRDNLKLIAALKNLRDIGNTVVVVEHDEETMLQADCLIDIGPYAGVNGGHVIAKGTPSEVMQVENSITGQYLSGKIKIEPRAKRRKATEGYAITLTGAKANNLKNVNLKIPLGLMVAVSGVSGSGKSSLIIETLYKALARRVNGSLVTGGQFDAMDGLQHIDNVIQIDQSPIGRTPRSNPATYCGLFTPIREWFSSLPEAKARGYAAGRFSFNVRGGRCEACTGDGVIKIEMHFMPDVYVTCDACRGMRYNRSTLDVKFRNKNISEILNMTVDEAMAHFENIPHLIDKLALLQKVGLGYIKLGQSATTLSGGEAQRIKLARELSKRATGRSFYLLDEPTTGLHAHDVSNLLGVLQGLVDKGNTILIIEHNMDVIKCSDWVIDLGPEGGDKGGQIVAQGTPDKVAACKESYTGQFLAKALKVAKKLSAA